MLKDEALKREDLFECPHWYVGGNHFPLQREHPCATATSKRFGCSRMTEWCPSADPMRVVNLVVVDEWVLPKCTARPDRLRQNGICVRDGVIGARNPLSRYYSRIVVTCTFESVVFPHIRFRTLNRTVSGSGCTASGNAPGRSLSRAEACLASGVRRRST